MQETIFISLLDNTCADGKHAFRPYGNMRSQVATAEKLSKISHVQSGTLHVVTFPSLGLWFCCSATTVFATPAAFQLSVAPTSVQLVQTTSSLTSTDFGDIELGAPPPGVINTSDVGDVLGLLLVPAPIDWTALEAESARIKELIRSTDEVDSTTAIGAAFTFLRTLQTTPERSAPYTDTPETLERLQAIEADIALVIVQRLLTADESYLERLVEIFQSKSEEISSLRPGIRSLIHETLCEIVDAGNNYAFRPGTERIYAPEVPLGRQRMGLFLLRLVPVEIDMSQPILLGLIRTEWSQLLVLTAIENIVRLSRTPAFVPHPTLVETLRLLVHEESALLSSAGAQALLELPGGVCGELTEEDRPHLMAMVLRDGAADGSAAAARLLLRCQLVNQGNIDELADRLRSALRSRIPGLSVSGAILSTIGDVCDILNIIKRENLDLAITVFSRAIDQLLRYQPDTMIEDMFLVLGASSSLAGERGTYALFERFIDEMSCLQTAEGREFINNLISQMDYGILASDVIPYLFR